MNLIPTGPNSHLKSTCAHICMYEYMYVYTACLMTVSCTMTSHAYN